MNLLYRFISISLLFISIWGKAQTVTLTIDNLTISEGNSATITATLSTASTSETIISFASTGSAVLDGDYEANYIGKGAVTTVAGGNGSGSAANQVDSPKGITIDDLGNLYVTERNNHRVQKWAPGATVGITVAGGNGQGDAANQLNQPMDVAIDANGDIYVADQLNHRIQKWVSGATSGTTVAGVSGTSGSAQNQLNEPLGIALDAAGNLYVADGQNYRIQKWQSGASTGSTVAGGNGYGSNANQLAIPGSIAFDASGDMYLTDGNNQRIQKWSQGASEGVTVAGGNGQGATLNQLNNPASIALDPAGNLYVSEGGNHRVTKWKLGASEGIIVAGGNGFGSGANQLNNPRGVVVDRFGNVYVALTTDHSIRKVTNAPQIIVAVGQTTATMILKATTDGVSEADETIILTPTATGATLTSSDAITLTIDDSVPTVTGVTSTTANGTYKQGDVIVITVGFSEVVNVTGTPQLTLETGDNDAVVNYSSGTGSNTLTFNYTIGSSETSSDLDYKATNSLALNGGTIKDAAGNLATLTLASPGATNSLGGNKALIIDTTVPTVTGVTSTTANGSYKQGDVIVITVGFSEVVNVTGTPQLTLETGDNDAVVNYSSGTGSNTLTFNYTIGSSETSSDLDYKATNSLALNGGTIKDAAGNLATLTLASPGATNSLGGNKALIIDTTVPTVTGVTSTTANGSYKQGDVIVITVGFSEVVNVTGTPQLTLETGDNDAVVNYSSGTGSNTLTFNYTIGSSETSSDLDYKATNSLALNGGTIKDAAGNLATLTLASPGATNSLGGNKALIIDTTVPTVTGVTSTTANGSYKQGDVIAITVEFSEVVNVTGTPQLTLETGDNDAVVNYSSGTGSNTLTFNYTIGSGETSDDLDYVSTNSLAISVTSVDADGDGFPDLDGNGDPILNIGTIKDAGLNDAILTLASPGATNSLGGNKDLKINEANQSIPNHVPSEGLISWYPFNGNANDESGSGNNGVVSGATLSSDANGNANSAYTFNGSSDYINIPNEFANGQTLSSQTFHIKFRFNQSGTYTLWNKDGSWREVRIEILDDNSIGLFWAFPRTYSSIRTATNSIALNTWNDVVIIVADDAASIFINGVKQVSYQDTDNYNTVSSSNISYSDEGSCGTQFGNNRFGFVKWSCSPKEYYSGDIDAFALWDRALTDDEILKLYSGEDNTLPTISITATNGSTAVSDGATSSDATLSLKFTASEATSTFSAADITVTNGIISNFSATSSTVYTATFTPTEEGATTIDVAANSFTDAAGNGNTASDQFNWTFILSLPAYVPSEGLISWYPFNGNANDESGSGNNGTLSGATLDLDRFGNLNSSFSFNGSTDYIAFNLGSIENKLPANSASTSSVWIKTEDLQGPIISLQGTGGYTYNLHIGTLSDVVKSSGDYGMMIRDNCCGIGNYKWGSNVVNNNWHMITIVRSSNGTLKLYKDGVLDATGNSGSSGELIFTPTKMAFGADLDWIILSKEGCGSCNTVDDQYFEGLLDDVGIWNRALTETEIIELYSGGDTPPKSGLDPTLTITARNDSGVVLDSTISNDSQVVLTFTTSQATTNFTVDDILVTNGTLSNFTAISSTIYTTNLTPLNDGSITVNVPMNVFTDAAGNSNTTSDQFNWIYDGTPPNMTISVTNGINSLSDGAVTADTSLIVTFTTNEPIINLYLEDIIVEGGGFLSFTKTSASVYTGTFAPYVVSDTILIKVLSSVFTDLVGNTNTSISQFNWIYDPNEEPIILSFNTTFPENIANGSIIGIIEAIDPDDDILSFNIISGNEKGAFKLDSVSGQLAVLDNVPLDFEINPSFELMISVSDGFHIIYATINISLSDVLENEDDETALSIMKDASKMIYPNPAMDIINIEMTEFKEATIYNLSGRKVLRSNDSRINVNSLIKGVYIMELENKSGERFSTKLIKD